MVFDEVHRFQDLNIVWLKGLLRIAGVPEFPTRHLSEKIAKSKFQVRLPQSLHARSNFSGSHLTAKIN